MARTATLTLPGAPPDPPLARGSIHFVGTATTVIQCGGFTLLTDPNFLHAGDHVHLGYGLFSRRRTDPAIEIDALPPLDACVLSHFHGDHWDRVATARLRKDLPVLTTRHAARSLRRRGFRRAHPLATWDSVRLARGASWLRITAMPGRHGPRLVHRLLPPVMGSMWEWGAGDGPARFRLYVSGDTLVYDDLRRIPERYPDVDAGLFHLGGTRVAGILVTMDARQGVEAIRIVRPDVAMAIHYDDYPVFRSPLEDFLRAADRAGLASRVHPLARGERWEFTVGERAGAGRPRAPDARTTARPRPEPPPASPGAGPRFA